MFRLGRRLVRDNLDVVGGGCVKDREGKIQVEEAKIKEVWREYYKNLLNEEFVWDKEGLVGLEPYSGPCELITESEVKLAIQQAKNGKAVGPSGVASDMLKAAGEAGVRWVTDLCNAIVKEGVIPGDWAKSWMVSVYKGKGDALECGSYRGIKLIDHVMKVLERVIEKRIRSRVEVSDMQFGFMPGKGTTDAIFIVRQLQEKYLGKKRELWMAFIDLEKAFDRVPREVLWWALRRVGVDEWLISIIKAMYVGVTTSVRTRSGQSEEFEVKVGVHQGSVLSPLLFAIVLEAVSKEFRTGLPWELLYADDLVLMAESEELLKDKIRVWKEGMEARGLKVNVAKTKVMKCHVNAVRKEKSGKYPCGMCNKGVGRNSIFCKGCGRWIHKRCSGVTGKLRENVNYRCANCAVDKVGSVDVEEKEVVLEDGSRFECVYNFCYLGDMIGAAGGVGEASTSRVRCAWGKFRELSQILTKKGVPLKQKGQFYRTCVQSGMVYASETWAVKEEDEHKLERNENAMIRWMCGVSLRDKIPTVELRARLGIEGVLELVRRGRLRWFGHVERKASDDWVSACRGLEVDGARGRGRPKKTWQECVNSDLKMLGLDRGLAQDRTGWRDGIMGKTSNPRARKNRR